MVFARRTSNRTLYTIWGALFGVCFPLGAWSADIFIFRGLNPELASIAIVHEQNPLHYIIDTAPFFLGLFASFAGIRQDRLQVFTGQLESLVDERTGQLMKRTADLEQSERALRGAKRESDAILANTAEGLFLLGPDFRIAGEYSEALVEMLGRAELAGANLIDVLGRAAPQELLDQCSLFFSMMFDAKRLESMVVRANPLEEIQFSGRILRFGFRRIVDDSAVQRLLGFVEDVTRQVELERQIQAERERGEGQMKLLFSLLHVPPAMLAQFLDQTGAALEEIEDRFESDRYADDYESVLTDLFRTLHNLKGNASTLGLEAYAQAAHAAEDEIERLRAQDHVAGKDFLALVTAIDRMRSLYGESRELLERTRRLHAAFSGDAAPDSRAMITAGVRDLIRRRCAGTGRAIELDDSEFDAQLVPGGLVPLMRDLLIQLVRNAIVHGIEGPEERARLMKPVAGLIRLKSESGDSTLRIICEDDGRGIDTAALKASAVAAGMISAAEARTMEPAEAARLIFAGGVSTAERTNDRAGMDAGRGVGMDLVRERLREVGGRVDVAFAPGKFSRFTISVPFS